MQISKFIGRTKLKLVKNSPEILLVIGVVGFVGTVALATRATLKVPEILEKANKTFDTIDDVIDNKEVCNTAGYTINDYADDVKLTYMSTGLEIAKTYAPAIILGTLSIAAIVASNGIIKKRYLSALAAYNALDVSYRNYRKAVVDEFGAEKDQQLRNGLVKPVTAEQLAAVEYIKTSPSDYSRFFDSASPCWEKDPGYNIEFLKIQEEQFSRLLRARGHVFLNEVYDALGIDRSTDGSLVGWVLGMGDDEVSFGIYDAFDAAKRRFVNGYENVILLDFNVDGIIFDKI